MGSLSLADIETLAGAALQSLPPPFSEAARSVGVQVVDWPDADMLNELRIKARLDLTGLYDGIPLTEKSAFDQPTRPDVIWLFREPILAELADRTSETAEHLIRHILVHELAHHFGWSDEDIASVDRWWE